MEEEEEERIHLEKGEKEEEKFSKFVLLAWNNNVRIVDKKKPS